MTALVMLGRRCVDCRTRWSATPERADGPCPFCGFPARHERPNASRRDRGRLALTLTALKRWPR